MHHPLSTVQFLLLAALLAILGCGDGSGRMSVKGKVTLDDQPVEAGSIVFLPSGEGTKAAAAIEKGEYAIAADEGLKPGTYRVEVSWFKPTGRKMESADPGIMIDETREAVPAKYNANSTLTAEITAGANVKDFPLTTK